MILYLIGFALIGRETLSSAVIRLFLLTFLLPCSLRSRVTLDGIRLNVADILLLRHCLSCWFLFQLNVKPIG